MPAQLSDRRLPWLGAGVAVLIAVAALGKIASEQWFWQDDVWYLSQARQEGLSWHFLSESFFGNFAPLFKAWYWLDFRVLDRSYGLMVALELVLLVLVLAQLVRLSRLLCHDSAAQPVMLALVALSALWAPSLLWAADGLHVLPSTLATLVGLDAYVRWVTERRRRWLVVLCLAQFAGLGYWAKAALLPIFALLLRVLVLDDGPVNRLHRRLKDDWPALLAVAVPCLLYAHQVSGSSYADPNNVRTGWVSLAPKVVGIGWFNGFWPGLFGLGPQSVEFATPVYVADVGQQPAWVALAAQLILGAIVAWTLWRRPGAWRPWAGLVLSWVATAVLITYAKPKTGTTIGREYRLMVDFAPIAAIWILLAVGRLRVPGAAALAAGPQRTLSGRLATGAVVLVGVGLVVHAITFVSATKRIEQPWKGKGTRAFVEQLRREVAASPDPHPAIAEGPVGGDLMAGGFGPYAQASNYVTLWAPQVRVVPPVGAEYTFDVDHGTLTRVPPAPPPAPPAPPALVPVTPDGAFTALAAPRHPRRGR